MENVRTELDLGMIFRRFGGEYEKSRKLPEEQRKALRAISVCRTSYLGGHMEKCEDCGREYPVYNSCRNPNCPKCQGIERRRWVQKRLSELLPVSYFHVIFTLPEFLSELYFYNQSVIGGILFRSTADTILHLSKKYFNGTPYIVSLLHSWGQTMSRHAHIHMLVSSGGLSRDRTEWKFYNSDYLFSVFEMSSEFKKLFMVKFASELRKGNITIPVEESFPRKTIKNMLVKEWVVNCRRPFAGPEKVIEYLGRYTYRTAISNRRILSVNDSCISFDYKDYKDTDENGVPVHKVMKLDPFSFISRFLQHIPPKGFRRIRFYGIAGGREKNIKIETAKSLLSCISQNDIKEYLPDTDNKKKCPFCGSLNITVTGIILPERPPPFKFINERRYEYEKAV